MKNRIILMGVAIMMATSIFSQVENPVNWEFSTDKVSGQEAELVFTATIDYPWHLYSAHLPEGGPIATKAWYDESDTYTLVDGIVESPKAKVTFDAGFQMDVGTLSGKAEFRQKVKFKDGGTQNVTGEIEFQVCDDEVCLPPKSVPFSFEVKLEGEEIVVVEAGTEEVVTETDLTAVLESNTDASDAAVAGVPAMEGEKSLWRFFWLAFGLGLLALLTPCVFPMIPMTVSFFMQGSDSRARGIFRGLIFGISIMAIYTLLGVIVSVSNVGPNAANALSTHWIPNLIFFALFMVFAFSFFGMFELVLPSSWCCHPAGQIRPIARWIRADWEESSFWHSLPFWSPSPVQGPSLEPCWWRLPADWP